MTVVRHMENSPEVRSMASGTDILSKENSLVLRGLAILSIFLHNFIHAHRFGFILENEGSFTQEKADAFFRFLAHPDWTVLFQFLSFLGWIGVPVFVFLTGYGLAKKYPPGKPLEKWAFLKDNYLKLLVLLLPGLLFFGAFDVLHAAWHTLAKRLAELTMLYNLYYSRLRVNPGVYWYFSLTFQFYVVYCFCRKCFKPWVLLLLSVLSLAGVYLLCVGDMPAVRSNFRACFTGWFPPFALGVWFAQDGRPGKWLEKIGGIQTFVLLLAFAALTVAMNARIVPWLLSPIAALFAFFALAKLVVRVPFLGGALKWIGGISASIFVCHPMVRHVLFNPPFSNALGINPQSPVSNSAFLVSLSIYLVLTLVVAWLFQKMRNWVTRRFLNRNRPGRSAGAENNPMRPEAAERSEA